MIHIGKCRKIRKFLKDNPKVLACIGNGYCGFCHKCQVVRSDEKEAHKLCESNHQKKLAEKARSYAGDGKTFACGPD